MTPPPAAKSTCQISKGCLRATQSDTSRGTLPFVRARECELQGRGDNYSILLTEVVDLVCSATLLVVEVGLVGEESCGTKQTSIQVYPITDVTALGTCLGHAHRDSRALNGDLAISAARSSIADETCWAGCKLTICQMRGEAVIGVISCKALLCRFASCIEQPYLGHSALKHSAGDTLGAALGPCSDARAQRVWF